MNEWKLWMKEFCELEIVYQMVTVYLLCSFRIIQPLLSTMHWREEVTMKNLFVWTGDSSSSINYHKWPPRNCSWAGARQVPIWMNFVLRYWKCDVCVILYFDLFDLQKPSWEDRGVYIKKCSLHCLKTLSGSLENIVTIRTWLKRKCWHGGSFSFLGTISFTPKWCLFLLYKMVV